MKMAIRTLFISDVHLGCRYAGSRELVELLDKIKKHPPEYIYIVGDFIDGWKFKRGWYWDNNANLVIQKLLKFAKQGVCIRLVIGNHDDFLRKFLEHRVTEFGNIHFADEFVHLTKDGRQLLVVHGDYFDLVAQYAKWVCWIGDWGYEVLMRINKVLNWFGRKLHMGHFSLSQKVKSNIKKAIQYISDYETYLAAYAEKKGFQGVICGHIHSACIKNIEGMEYYNCGDFLESCTAI